MDLVSFETPIEFKMFEEVMIAGKYWIKSQNHLFHHEDYLLSCVKFINFIFGLCKIYTKAEISKI